VRLTVEIDGKPTVVDVADDLGSVTVGATSYPVKVVARGPSRVDLEIGGETVVVEGWPDRQPTPPGPLDVNGERRKVTVRAEGTGVRPAGPRAAEGSPTAAGSSPGPVGAGTPPGATPVLPPMPGRVVELRVREGETVPAGAVLLVVEAMKMRNEVTAPVAGVVRDVRVREGSNVRAREPMLFLAPA